MSTAWPSAERAVRLLLDREDDALAVAGPPDDQVGLGGADEVALEVAPRPVGLGGRGELADHGDLRVEVLARAGRRRGVTVAVDRLEVLAADALDRAARGDAVQRQLPREQRAVRLRASSVARLDQLEVADRRHGEGVRVVVERVRADHRTVDAAVAAFPDPTEAVDEEVVADVGPAAGLRVVGVDRPEDGRHVLALVVVGVDRVVHETAVHLEVRRRAVAHRLVGTPLGARVDHRLGRDRGERARRGGGRGAQRDVAVARLERVGESLGALDGSTGGRDVGRRELRGVDRRRLLRGRPRPRRGRRPRG